MLYDFQTSRDAVAYIYNDDGYIHVSWEVGNGQILSFEVIPVNYPPGSYKLWDSEEEYVDAIKEVSWIMDKMVTRLKKGDINDELTFLVKAIERYERDQIEEYTCSCNMIYKEELGEVKNE